MVAREPFILLDDARSEGAGDAHIFESPREIFVARRPEEVADVLARADAARQETGGTLAGYIAYETGLALEPRLQPLAAARSGADGPLVWFGLFEKEERLPAAQVPAWLAARAEPGPATIGPLEPQISTGAYLAAFERLQEAIRAGDIYQANLTFPLAGAARGDPQAIYAAIRPAAHAGHGALCFDGMHWLLSFSPELFVTLEENQVTVRPMKGTRPRGADEKQDAAFAAELAQSVKDKAENLMIVDLMRNDLARVAIPGSVSVEGPFAIESYPTVHQMVSTITAELAEGQNALALLRALFPCGSITGAPKIRAMELIDEVECDPRGPYCGAIGMIDGAGNARFNVAIRTVRLTPGENNRHHAVAGVGGAIVADSDGMAEWRECLVKGSFLRQSSTECQAPSFELIETMRFDPQEGIPMLELHLERMKASAVELGFSFDRHEARNQIQALCFELDAAARLRLLLSRSGAITLQTGPLPVPFSGTMQCVALPHPLVAGDWRLAHKTSDRSFYEAALDVAKLTNANEALLVRENGQVVEGSYTNIFVKRGDTFLTPPTSSGLLSGILRRALIAEGKAAEAELTLDDLGDGFFLGNALRGLMPARLQS
ncbi:aminodeoxychorismate synthase component I [Altericroceibacterium spongiae]|uniref:Probable branched-chain-amino-acid aminotransferase n=1 Tax=Altericroceibacterium spongiae TaxID=2320269 RepID=A0A420EPC6_9SPHN|nr:aminodeoxychorismate synthase component I [Altericroceibacterium spongiae]RKF22527.1 aminodeoxychorismate synthase component I [Altericroceibacterium spongiae]